MKEKFIKDLKWKNEGKTMATIANENDYRSLKNVEFLYDIEKEYVIEGKIIDVYRKNTDYEHFWQYELILELELYINDEVYDYEYCLNSSIDIYADKLGEYFKLKAFLENVNYEEKRFDYVASEDDSEKLLDLFKSIIMGKTVLLKKKAGNCFSQCQLKIVSEKNVSSYSD